MAKRQKLTLTASLPAEIVLTRAQSLDIRHELSLYMMDIKRKAEEIIDEEHPHNGCISYVDRNKMADLYNNKSIRVEKLFDLINDKLGIEMEEVQ